MQRKSIFLMAALVVGLTLGFVLGPLLRSASASAQTQPPATSQQSSGTSLKNLFLDQLAATLNIQRATLDSAIVTAGTNTADAAVQQGTLTQAQADALKARIQAGDLGALWGGRGGFRSGPRLEGVKQAILDAAANALNLTTDELMTQLRSGQTLDQLAQANGTTAQAVTDAALAAAKTRLDQSVNDGTLTQAQADAIYAQLQQQGTQLLTPRGRGFGGHRRLGDQSAPATPQTPTTSANA